MLTSLLHPLLNLHGWPVYAVVGGLVFAETGLLVGFFFPGETAIIVGGVVCSRHHDSVWVMAVVAVVAAVAGGFCGYWVGHRFGPRLLAGRLVAHRQAGMRRATAFVADRGAWGVFACRFMPFLRAVVPGLAGAAAMPRRPFAVANVAGGVLWAGGYCLLGFAVGQAYTRLERYSNLAGYVLLGLVAVAVAVLVVRSRRREQRAESAGDAAPAPVPGPTEGAAGP